MSIKSLIFLLPLAAVGVDAAAAATCAKNDCYTQVSANRFAPSAFRSSGCYSFMASTVTPTAATVTKTVAAGFAVVTPGPACATTTAGPSVLPAYASSCANTANYMSACRCFGITMRTKTLKRCTTTVLSTTTVAGTTTIGGATTTSFATVQAPTGCSNQGLAFAVYDNTVTDQQTGYFNFEPSDFTTTIGGATTTSFATVQAPTGCSNQGLAFAVYDNTVTDQQTGYFNFEPSDFTTPVYQGTISQIQNIYVPAAQAQAPIYNQYVHSSTQFVLNHVAYLFAPQSGTYTFAASNVNDVFNFWIGQNAYSGYNRENDNLDTYFFYSTTPTVGNTASGIPGAASYSVQLVGGLYYPFRYVFAQDTGAATFNFAITAPDGSQIASSSEPNSPYVVRFSCDGALAPAFPGFNNAAAVTVTPTTLTSAASTITPLTSVVGATSVVGGVTSDVTSVVGGVTSVVGGVTSIVGGVTSILPVSVPVVGL